MQEPHASGNTALQGLRLLHGRMLRQHSVLPLGHHAEEEERAHGCIPTQQGRTLPPVSSQGMPAGHHLRYQDSIGRGPSHNHRIRDGYGEDHHLPRRIPGTCTVTGEEDHLPYTHDITERPGDEGAPCDIVHQTGVRDSPHRTQQVLPPVQGNRGIREPAPQGALHDVRGEAPEEHQGTGRGMQILRQGQDGIG